MTDAELDTDDYDNPWKDVLEGHFEDAMRRFFPSAHHRIDWARGHEFLDTELRQITRDAETGRRHVDKLVRVWLKDGREEWVLLHVEVQVQPDADFARRMFTYLHRIYDRYGRLVASFAILADDRPRWRPDHFAYALLGTRLRLDFATVKLLDLDAEDPAHADNPFSAVITAHRRALETRRDPLARFRWKTAIMRSLYTRGYDRRQIVDLFRFIDWVMRLPVELDAAVHQTIHEIQEECAMPYVTSLERRAEERARIELLRRLLSRRFGPLPDWAEARLSNPMADELLTWVDRVLDAADLEGVFGR